MSEREYFACVGRRRGTFVGTASSFHQLTAFLTGYDQHAMRHGGQGLWLCARERVLAQVLWSVTVGHRLDLEEGFLLWRDRRVKDVAEAGDVLAPLRPVRGFGP